MANDGDALKFENPISTAKYEQCIDGLEYAIKSARKHNVRTAFGCDMLFDPAQAAKQGKYLAKMTKWYTPFEALKMATSTNAELLKLCGPRDPYPGELGVVKEGALGDLILADGDTLTDIWLVADPDKNFVVIMKDGKVYKNALQSAATPGDHSGGGLVSKSYSVAESGHVFQIWDALMPGSELAADDAYSRLSEMELGQLACLARIRWLLATGRDAPDGVSAQEGSGIVRDFAQRGRDADWLLAQRDAVRRNRIENSFNPAVEGRRAELTGLVLPLDCSTNGRFTKFLLTPEVRGCSHEPPPPHNQVVYIEIPSPIRVTSDEAARQVGELRLSVYGSIRFAATSHKAFRVDGLMRVDASYTIEPDHIS